MNGNEYMAEILLIEFNENKSTVRQNLLRNVKTIEKFDLIRQILDSNIHFSALLDKDRRIVQKIHTLHLSAYPIRVLSQKISSCRFFSDPLIKRPWAWTWHI